MVFQVVADKKRRIFLCWLWPYKGKEKYFCMINNCCKGLSICCAILQDYAMALLRKKRCPNKCRPADHQDWEYC